MARMTSDQAKVFALTLVPEGVFEQKEAQEWCDFLNFILEADAWVPIEITDKDHWAYGKYGVST